MFALLLSALENNALVIKNVCFQVHLDDREANLCILYKLFFTSCYGENMLLMFMA